MKSSKIITKRFDKKPLNIMIDTIDILISIHHIRKNKKHHHCNHNRITLEQFFVVVKNGTNQNITNIKSINHFITGFTDNWLTDRHFYTNQKHSPAFLIFSPKHQ